MPATTSLINFVLLWAVRIGAALLVLVIGRMVVNRVVRFSRHYMARRNLDALVVTFVANILNWTLLLFVIILAFNQLGVDTTAMVALLGAAGLAIGLALQDSMKNFAAGVMLIIFHPFSVGHFVEAGGVSGSVEGITLFTSTLLTADNREIVVPNNAIYTGSITNYSARPTRRVDLVFGVSYDDDLRKARELLQQIVAADARILAEPAPTIAVGELAASSVNFYVRPWVATGDYWSVLFDITERVKLAFDDNGITIPYPQVDVHMQTPAQSAVAETSGVSG